MATPFNKDSIVTVLSLATPYALIISILYHWGYWGAPARGKPHRPR
jgi:hypothetical protein